MKKVLFSFILALVLLTPKGVSAEETCTTVYGGGVVCGASTPEHEPVETGIIDNPAVLGSVLLGSSYIFGQIAKRLKSKQD